MITIRRRALALASALVPALVAALALPLPAAHAQATFSDVPEGHWAGAAVARIAASGIVTGFPDGTFRGNDAVTRYQLALVASRLLDALEPNLAAASGADAARLEALRTDLASLAAIAALNEADAAALAASLETRASAADVEALRDRVGALRERVAALEARLERVRAQVAREGPPGSPGAPGIAGESGDGNGDAERGDAAEPGVEASTPGAPDGEPGDSGGAPFRLAPVAERGGVYLGVGASTDPGFLVYLPRLTVGADDLFGPFGARLSIDYGRQSGGDFGAGTLAAAAHVTYTARFEEFRPYVGIGGGYQADLFGGGYNEGAFAGGLVGLEVPLGGTFGVYVESDLDYYVTSTVDGEGGFRPRFGLGVRVRF